MWCSINELMHRGQSYLINCLCHLRLASDTYASSFFHSCLFNQWCLCIAYWVLHNQALCIYEEMTTIPIVQPHSKSKNRCTEIMSQLTSRKLLFATCSKWPLVCLPIYTNLQLYIVMTQLLGSNKRYRINVMWHNSHSKMFTHTNKHAHDILTITN